MYSFSSIGAFVIGTLASGLASWGIASAWTGVSQRSKLLKASAYAGSGRSGKPRGGGVGIVGATLVGMSVLVATGRVENISDARWAGGLALFVAAVGFLDDVGKIRLGFRLACYLGAAIVATSKLGVFTVLTIPFLAPIVLSLPAATLLTVIWIFGLTHVYDFMDGIDGMAGMQGIAAGLAWAWFGANVASGGSMVLWSGLTVTGACAGFLPHNWPRAKVIMGDVGSSFLGFSFAIMPLLVLHGREAQNDEVLRRQGALPIFAAFVLWPFVADAAYTLFWRVLRRENLLLSHRSHLYQRMATAGWTQARILFVYMCLALVGLFLGCGYLLGSDRWRLAVLAVGMLTLCGLIWIVVRIERIARVRPSRGEGRREC